MLFVSLRVFFLFFVGHGRLLVRRIGGRPYFVPWSAAPPVTGIMLTVPWGASASRVAFGRCATSGTSCGRGTCTCEGEPKNAFRKQRVDEELYLCRASRPCSCPSCPCHWRAVNRLPYPCHRDGGHADPARRCGLRPGPYGRCCRYALSSFLQP